jgi:hypothetical protein
MSPSTSKAVLDATEDALSTTISEAFDIPLYGLEDQLAGVSNKNTSSPQQMTESNISNAHEKDDPGDQALIDLIPVPADSQTPDDLGIFDPLAGILE